MQRGRFENRAKWLSANHRSAKGIPERLPTSILPRDYWETVKCREDVVTYYQLYHPELGDELIRALADNIENAKNGYVKLEKHWYGREAQQKMENLYPTEYICTGKDAQYDDVWDPMAEVEEQRQLVLLGKPEKVSKWAPAEISSEESKDNEMSFDQ